MRAARENLVVRLQSCLLDPLLHSVTGGRCDLELERMLGLVLQHDCARCNLVCVAAVPDLQADEVAAAKLAVDTQLEEGQLLEFRAKQDAPSCS